MIRTGLEVCPDTFIRNLNLSTLDDLDGLGRLITGALGHVLDLLDDVVAFEYLAEDYVASVEPRGDGGGDKELAAVGVLARIGHACGTSGPLLQCCVRCRRTECALLAVLQLEVLVWELRAVNALAACAIAFREVATLDHELLDHPVEGRPLEAKALLAGG